MPFLLEREAAYSISRGTLLATFSYELKMHREYMAHLQLTQTGTLVSKSDAFTMITGTLTWDL